ncbi:MAG: hypothetical protein GC191_16765 [Azospirillum sp.]|nr:hypothetical protein [Azospirillum sp.]
MVDPQRFADLRQPRSIWAVSAIHGDASRLAALHDALYPRITPGERLVYLGNFLGRGAAIVETVNELLEFRRALLALPGMLANDLVYLRGGQEEMWQKLLQLQFAPNPPEVLDWMLRQGAAATLEAYGGRTEQGMQAARGGAKALTRWTNGLRAAIRAMPGHENLLSALRRAAFTSLPETSPPSEITPPVTRAPQGVLLVNAGIDPNRPLGAQGDSFWWGGGSFARIAAPYGGFRRVCRGYDPGHGGVRIDDHAATLDGGCGFGGRLIAANLSRAGDIVELIEA